MQHPTNRLGALSIVALLSTLTFGAGCTSLPLADAAKSFDQSVKTGTEAMGELYRSLNLAESDLYYLMIELDPECELADTLTIFMPDEDSTSLCKKPKDPSAQSITIANPTTAPPFSEAGLNRRMQLLAVMSKYSATLTMAASAKTPEQYQQEVAGLSSDLVDLESSIRALARSPAETEKDKSFAEAVVSPLSTLVGVVGRWVLERKQRAAVERAVMDGRGPFETITSFLAADLKNIYLPAATTVAADHAATLSLFYAAQRKQMTLAERTEIITRVRRAEQASQAITLAKPEAIPEGLLDAHRKLVKAVLPPADGTSRPASLQEVQASLERLLADLALVVDSTRKLKAL